jgi:hypothetical protein
MAFCLEDSPSGRAAREALAQIPTIDVDYVQLGSAEWFWEHHPNSYALQVEPARHMTKDEATLSHAEALHTQHIRDLFFIELEQFLMDHQVLSRLSQGDSIGQNSPSLRRLVRGDRA